jgi:hypothetical protein
MRPIGYSEGIDVATVDIAHGEELTMDYRQFDADFRRKLSPDSSVEYESLIELHFGGLRGVREPQRVSSAGERQAVTLHPTALHAVDLSRKEIGEARVRQLESAGTSE